MEKEDKGEKGEGEGGDGLGKSRCHCLEEGVRQDGNG